jgi:hypothetical protein
MEWLRRCLGDSVSDLGATLRSMPHPGSGDMLAAQVPLLNGHEVPAGVHHDVANPIPVVVTLRWATGDEVAEALAVEWWTRGAIVPLVRVRLRGEKRLMTGCVWVPAGDVRRR